jgi:hypothetical protein
MHKDVLKALLADFVLLVHKIRGVLLALEAY